MSLSSSTSLNIDNEGVSNNGKKPLKEGPVQMTSLSTLLSFHRYYFLYQDTLFVSKQKGPGSFKLKEKLRLSDVWVASSNTVDSFLIGWPMTNYLLHFRTNEEKEEWFELLGFYIQQNLKPLFTMISMDINVRGRKQIIRRRIDNGKKSGELVVETANDLALPNTSYELKLVVGDSSGKSLQGPENVYAVIMHEIRKTGVRISESQKQALDTFPMLNCRLILSTMKSTKTSTPMQFVNSIKKKVLHRMDSRSLLGKELDAATPPQTIMTIVDHLKIFGCDTEGIFRKSPKQSTFKELRTELEKGLVPDLNKYSTHVLASMLKEYLRSIPGKILQSSNYDMWMKEVVNEEDLNKKITSTRNLLSLLPSPHLMLLSNVLKLLAKISASATSKMTASALSVCLGPSFLESSDQIEGGKKIPLLVEFLINYAGEVVPGFNSDCVFSILQTVDHNSNVVTNPSICSDDDAVSQKTPIIEEIDGEEADALSQSSLSDSISVNSVAHAPSSNRIPSLSSSGSSELPTAAVASTSSLTPGSLSSSASYSLSSVASSSQYSYASKPTTSAISPFSSSTCIAHQAAMSSMSSEYRHTSSSAMISDSDDDFDEEKEENLNDALKMLLLKKQTTDVNVKEAAKESMAKMEERRSGDTPRSPCLKRIHFQRTQEAQLRNASKQSNGYGLGSLATSSNPSARPMYSETSPRESEVSMANGRRVSSAVAAIEQSETGVPAILRKESKEEATQTIDLEQQQRQNLANVAIPTATATSTSSSINRFPAFRSTTTSLNDIKPEIPSSPRIERRDHVRDVKPTVQVHPFMNKDSMLWQNTSRDSVIQTVPTVVPASPSISERLAQLRERQVDEVEVESPRFVRKSYVPPTPVVLPPVTNTTCTSIASPKLQEDCDKNLPILITEKFSPYCIEPATDYGSLKTSRRDVNEDNSESPKRVELQRSSSQREQKSPASLQRELQRAYSVKTRRDRNEYIGMDPLEINWSVRQLKTLFQDKRAPAIDTDYNYPNF